MTVCRVCGSASVAGRYRVPEMMFGTREEFDYFQCAACLCLQISKVPDDLPRHYAGGYYSYERAPEKISALRRWTASARHRYALHGRDLAGWLLYRRAPAVAMRSLRLCRLRPQTRVLDVGCGAGLLIHDLADLGYREVLGIDPYIDEDIVYDNGARVRKLSIDAAPGQWDVIMFHHSFEHVPDPLWTLREVGKRLEEGGHCILRVPTVSSWAWQHYGIDWVQLDAPRHLFLFARESIECLAAAAGFKVVDVTYDAYAFQFWGSEQYRRGIPLRAHNSYAVNPEASPFSKDEIDGFARRSDELNRQKKGDQAAFCLRKVTPSS